MKKKMNIKLTLIAPIEQSSHADFFLLLSLCWATREKWWGIDMIENYRS
jgi:hypothetical protein